jgi:FixJ family two-component response regulator
MEMAHGANNAGSLPGPLLHGALSRDSKTPTASADGAIAYLVDGNKSFREDLSALLIQAGITVISFASAQAYLTYHRTDMAGCLILNTSLPDISGLELQRRLAKKANPPVIFISAQCDIPTTVCAMKAGAIEFLTAPIDWLALLAAVKTALEQDRRQRKQRAELIMLQERLALLTPRESDVLPLIVGGLLNKQAAAVLGISEVTLQIHRSQIMRKMQAESFADLVRMAVKLRIRHWRESQPSPCARTHPDKIRQPGSQVVDPN